MRNTSIDEKKRESYELSLQPDEVVRDYRLCYRSRQASLIGRREVMSGKAKFGIFGDGKELPQVALAHFFQNGDFRSGYYRDQTLIFALAGDDDDAIRQFFAQLYAHADVGADPASGGRAMNAHFGSRLLDADGTWKDLTAQHNSSSDISPTGSQMPRLVGLAYASRLYRELPELHKLTRFSRNGDEIAWGTIGNATTSEGMFWEAINAIGVLKSPAVISIWDDTYGISVENEFQMVKQNLSELLKGFQRDSGQKNGYDIYTVRGWHYPELIDAYRQAAENARRDHIPAILHVIELTQPQGHSTSGSHERYKSKERLAWEQEYDGLRKFREWIVDQGIETAERLEQLEAQDRKAVESLREQAWKAYIDPIRLERQELTGILDRMALTSSQGEELASIKVRLGSIPNPQRRDLISAAHQALLAAREMDLPERDELIEWKQTLNEETARKYDSYSNSETGEAAGKIKPVPAQYRSDSPEVNGFEVINAFFNSLLQRDPRVIIFGEDVGKLGDVNQGCKGLQEKYGELRVSDTGIREVTIAGQAIGMALRGLRPIAEIQYLDYVLYALQLLSDDLASLYWRTAGGQKAPAIIRTRGHRLEGIWHSGSPMAGIINLVRGMNVLVPRNLTKAAGFYNTLLKSDEPGIIVEVLNGYRLKEKLPANLAEYTEPLGIPEVIRDGTDATIVTYGATCRIVMEAANQLSRAGVEVEVIDVQTLLPFDVDHRIVESLKKTGRILFVDEDMPGGTTAYMMQEVLEKQGGYFWLDSQPQTLPAKPHRPAYGSDGDYWSKPNAEQVFEAVYEMMHEAEPDKYPIFYRQGG